MTALLGTDDEDRFRRGSRFRLPALDDAKIIESEEVLPGIVFDFNSYGGVVGIEILGVKKKNIRHLISHKIPFPNSADFKAFESFLMKHAHV
jgi:uncharacterized protein YuzE